MTEYQLERILDSILSLAGSKGCQIERDNQGQIVIYTNLMNSDTSDQLVPFFVQTFPDKE